MNRMMQMCRSLHESGANVETEFDFYLEAKRYESLLLEKGPIDIPGYREMAAEIDELEHFVQADNAPKCLCHNDFFYLNFLIDENDKYYLCLLYTSIHCSRLNAPFFGGAFSILSRIKCFPNVCFKRIV